MENMFFGVTLASQNEGVGLFDQELDVYLKLEVKFNMKHL